jgi:cell division septum initiation protein DivIVA
MTKRQLGPSELAEEARSALRPTSRFRWRGVTESQLRGAATEAATTIDQGSQDARERERTDTSEGSDEQVQRALQRANEVLGQARQEADEVLSKAERQAGQITSDAKARAESLERDAMERHRQAMGSVVQQREDFERRIDDLRAFEREYRSRLKAYFEGQLRNLEEARLSAPSGPAKEQLEGRIDDLRAFEREYRRRLKAYFEGQLRDLEAGATDSGVFPAITSAPSPSSEVTSPPGTARRPGRPGEFSSPELPHQAGRKS